MESNYNFLIPTPTEIAIGNYKGTHIARSKNLAYTPQEIYALAKEDFTSWWAIGMAFYLNNVLQVIVVSNNEKQACVQSKNFANPGNTIEFLYGDQTYYYSAIALEIADDYIDTDNTIIPAYSAIELTITSYEDAAKTLLKMYVKSGGVIPGKEIVYSKVEYTRINWENKSTSLKTPLNESNLNKMDKAINDLCENLDIAHTESDVKKLDKSSANKLLSETPIWDADTGILTFKFFDGTQFSVDFNIEKIPVSFSMDSAGVITMETADGTKWTADISKAIPNAYSFSNGTRITFTETTSDDGTKKITADLVKGSITDEYLATDFLAKITSNVNAASSSATSAASSATDAAADAKLAQSYAIGGSGMRDGEDADNAKYYAQKSAENLEYAKNLVTSGDDITE